MTAGHSGGLLLQGIHGHRLSASALNRGSRQLGDLRWVIILWLALSQYL